MSKIIVVDDEQTLTDMLRECLMGAGHTVSVCSDPMEAERMILIEKPDLAVIDYQMPRKTGVELLADLRAIQETRDLPVLFISGTQTVRFAQQIPPEPRVRFLSKPVDLETLVGIIREMLDPNGWSKSL